MTLKNALIVAVLIGVIPAAPASAQTTQAYEAAEQAYRLQAAGDHAAALQQARQAVTAAPLNGEYWALLGQEAGAVEQWTEAAEAYQRAASLTQDGDARDYRFRAAVYSYVMAGQREAALGILAQAASDPLVSLQGSVDWMMVAIAAGDDRLAQSLLDDGPVPDTMNRQQLLDAAYSAKRRGLDDRAVQLFRQGLARQQDGPLDAGQRAAIEREITLLANRWSLSGQIAYAESDQPLALFNQGSTTGQTLQGGLELGYRPFGWQNGRPLTLFGRTFVATQLNDDGLMSDVVQGWAGLQYKPLSNANLVLEASRLIALNDAAIDDWGLRAAFSQENGLDVMRGRSDWTAWRLYGDLAYLIDADVAYGAFEGRYGRAFNISDIIVTPHALAYAGYDSSRNDQWGTAVGGGLSARRWLANRGVGATPSYVDLTVQYRAGISGAEQIQGLSVVLSFGT
ncbi:hypothetical protein GRI44_12835 [Altererythrobacter confluentis]|uniref:Bacteriophage N4 adsorption protein A C-terminal domain-containing protein n=1 Tax=Allopontixanthobacter confluentis TaxID=1849021 RepID=A0A6L7GK05_9SPHN|nr:hypothetical protein [Allopontixanthobacter confluentis]MXP15634.1 hypothetical protein [Allopontixanthobacter confluentis]